MTEPFFKDNMTTIYLGDCVQIMAELSEGLYDLIVTSPPYNIGKGYEANMDYGTYLKLLWDFYYQGFRVIRKGQYAIVVFAPYHIGYSGDSARFQPTEYLHHIIAEKAGWVHQATRIWQKDFATLEDKYSIATNMPKLEYEYIACFRKPGGGREKVREQKYHPKGIWSTVGVKQQKGSSLQRHPAAFPEVLVRMILEVYSSPEDTVIDPFMGSGTTLYVAKKMNRKAIGIELNEEYAVGARLLLSQQVLDQGLLALKEKDDQKQLFPETEDNSVRPATEMSPESIPQSGGAFTTPSGELGLSVSAKDTPELASELPVPGGGV